MNNFFYPYGKVPVMTVIRRREGKEVIVSAVQPKHFNHDDYIDRHDKYEFDRFKIHVLNNFNAKIMDRMHEMIDNVVRDGRGSYKAMVRNSNDKINFYDVEQALAIKTGNVYEAAINDFLIELGADFKFEPETRVKMNRQLARKLDTFCMFQNVILAGEIKFNLRLDSEKGPEVKRRIDDINTVVSEYYTRRFVFLVSLSYPTLDSIKALGGGLNKIRDDIYGWKEFFASLNVWFNEREWRKLVRNTHEIAKDKFYEVKRSMDAGI